jgi:hypothetical protein
MKEFITKVLLYPALVAMMLANEVGTGLHGSARNKWRYVQGVWGRVVRKVNGDGPKP